MTYFSPSSYGVLGGVVVALVIVLLRNARPRSLKIERLWIRPVLFLAILVSTLAVAPPPLTATGFGLISVALALGAALGWLRGAMIRITVDPESHALTSQASPAGVVFILALVLMRMGLRGALAGGRIGGVPAVTAADAVIGLGAALMIAQSLEMWLRARRMLAEARAA